MAARILVSVIMTLLHIANGQQQRTYGVGVMVAELDDGSEAAFCIKYFPHLYDLPMERQKARVFKLADLAYYADTDSCDNSQIPEFGGQFAFFNSSSKLSNCSVDIRAHQIQDHGGSGFLADQPLSSNLNDSSALEALSIPVAALYSQSDREVILHLRDEFPAAKFFFYAPNAKTFDFSLVVIFFMAVFTVGFGSIWSGYTKQYLKLRSAEPRDGRRRAKSCSEDDEERICGQNEDEAPRNGEEVSLRVSPLLVMCFVVAMCAMLILLYLFFDKLVYVIIAMFCLASVIAIYSCFEPVVMWSYDAVPCCPVLRLPRCNLYMCMVNLEVRQFALLCASVAVTAVWFAFRKSDWAWVLQDAIGILFSINMLKTLRLPSLKICTLLLSALFVYDIFFVFITPLITKHGKSVMVEVATGGNTGEQLPMVLKVPHINSDPMGACHAPYLMLGFGDILVPGLLLSFCHAFDLQKGGGLWIYWATSNIAYALGLIATFVSLYLMNTAQPALLYLVPFILLPVVVVAAIRGDLSTMWAGDFDGEDHPTANAVPKDQNEENDEGNATSGPK